MGRLDELESFVEVVSKGSFSQAARQLGISKSYVSKHISRLEDRLGARLLNRTTRQLTLTEAGQLFYDRCVMVLQELAQAERSVNQLQASPRGTLRMSVPVSFGVRFLSPLVATFRERYPELNVEVAFSDRLVNIIDEGFDLAVRIGKLSDSSLHARKLADTRNLLCASPGYIKEHGAPSHPSELRQHNCLRYAYQSTGNTWRVVHTENGEEAFLSEQELCNGTVRL